MPTANPLAAALGYLAKAIGLFLRRLRTSWYCDKRSAWRKWEAIDNAYNIHVGISPDN
jgi:hypothetical protein